MSEWERELDRQLSLRHAQAEALVCSIQDLFGQLWGDRDPKVALDHDLREQSLHITEVAFSVREQVEGEKWRVFPRIILSSASPAKMELFYTTEDGSTQTEQFSTIEAFAAALVHRVREVSGRPPPSRRERRFHLREPMQLPTIVTAADGESRQYGSIVNRSREGAMVELSTPAELPDYVTILIEEVAQPCRVVWQDGTRAGLAFLAS